MFIGHGRDIMAIGPDDFEETAAGVEADRNALARGPPMNRGSSSAMESAVEHEMS